MPEISVIVPVYKAEAYLSRCVDSILAQTFTDFELILVDDGSPDRSGTICDEYAARDARIRVIHKPNGGLSDARNTGIDASTGDWLMFVDSDDYIAPNMAEALHTAVTQHNADMATCNVKQFGNNPDTPETDWIKIKSGVYDGIELLKSGDFMPPYVVAWNKIYAKRLWQSLRYPVGRIHEDEFVIHLLFSACKKVVCLTDALYYYRENPNGITKRPYSLSRLDYLDALADRLQYYIDNRLSEYMEPIWVVYFEQLRIKYFLLEDNADTHKRLSECRRTARRFFPDFFKRSKVRLTLKIATLIFLYCPSLYKAIWHRSSK